MRDVGILIWVVFLIVGVVGSMVSSARRQVAARAEPRSAPVPPQAQPTPQGRQGTSFVVPVTQGDTASSARSALLRQLSESQAQGDNSVARQRLVQTLLAQAQAPAAAPPTAAPAPPVPPRPPPFKPAPVRRNEPPAAPEVQRPKPRPLFGTGPDLVRAVIAAEVLGKPRGLHDEYR
jgi:hypothetical protein